MNATETERPEKILPPEHDGTAAPGPSGDGTVGQVKDLLQHREDWSRRSQIPSADRSFGDASGG
ncbi:hypothetical protein ACGF8B_31275 [Streptomyces sp. NPDC047917]|uniref:hypothetical protein n=1 Tax=Streptomyces sp. NPDC047917 TaxID=3365491 RepID=UPI003723F17D